MRESICGIDCAECEYKDNCAGCRETKGCPSGSECVIAACCRNKGLDSCGECSDLPCGLKAPLIAEFNSLGIEDMAKVTELYTLSGSYINLKYKLPSGESVKLLDDNKIYLGNQIEKKNSTRCYGLAAGESFLLVCEYGANGSDAEIVIYKRRRPAFSDAI